ncbi:MAG: Rieske (2Fe-2S) protein [Tardiphaga sp.]|jgi:nitrite reductase/ring-hydroxylating ferredoxin subunit|nr:Rieske (2Fe-2S) protein [Tardiphaga sp.]
MSSGDNWHPVGLSHSIEAGSSAGTRLFGQELVVWRDTSGTAHVWEDRCPHRGMKLSFGFVRGDHIACLYHGWQYDRAGYCQYIPAHPDLDVPKTFKVPVYLTKEQGGMIWTTLSENPPPLPADRDQTVPLRSLYFDCGVAAAIAALGTVRLTPFASQGLTDTTVRRLTETLYTVSSGDDRLQIGIQAISETRTALHLTICGWPKLYEGFGQSHFLDWALQLRRAIEQPARGAAVEMN